jgi:hypothetical protein
MNAGHIGRWQTHLGYNTKNRTLVGQFRFRGTGPRPIKQVAPRKAITHIFSLAVRQRCRVFFQQKIGGSGNFH